MEEKDNIKEREYLYMETKFRDLAKENRFLKQKHNEKLDEVKKHIENKEKKIGLFEKEAQKLKQELDQLSEQVKVDFNKIQKREKMLENQLEITMINASKQVSEREKKIVELKRKVDQLEFSLKKSKDD